MKTGDHKGKKEGGEDGASITEIRTHGSVCKQSGRLLTVILSSVAG